MNLYTYPLNPVIGIDPLGLCVEDRCIIEGEIFLSFLLGIGSTTQTQQSQQADIDQYGRKVNPEADILTSEHESGLNSGGNCTPQDLNDLQNEKNRLCN